MKDPARILVVDDTPANVKLLADVLRARGYAVENEEEEANVACVAAPFFGADARVAGAVGVTAFAKDLAGTRQQRAAGTRLMDLAAAISSKLGYDSTAPRA